MLLDIVYNTENLIQ